MRALCLPHTQFIFSRCNTRAPLQHSGRPCRASIIFFLLHIHPPPPLPTSTGSATDKFDVRCLAEPFLGGARLLACALTLSSNRLFPRSYLFPPFLVTGFFLSSGSLVAATREACEMCHAVHCFKCGKTTWVGCGKHVEQVKASIHPDRWCECPRSRDEPCGCCSVM